ncbi:hypothetical protein C454_08354 [Haloferax gibbonsii ATCC 33959]|uniref:Small CPxCG-related zinc finger protein n=1 Tax=Haloferax gibbonsii (strain ATCC 33959 / DSM 4427 / JCM 8863 / NBRC 102184 / NCIMB 2188 / Ma 2.38) TaxID=1227459 RepID=M0HB05_HALGM|nr:hypothetical protein C454_08354 [Haloferax gibbonsii ATCC 33959]
MRARQRSDVTDAIECTYCGSDVRRHDPVFVAELEAGERVPAGAFCNYACLSSHIDAAGLTTGASCEWRPE